MRTLIALLALAATFTAASDNTVRIDTCDTYSDIIAKAATLTPSPRQLRALDDGFIAFVHFGPNTFNGVEWGTGSEDPAVFNPSALDTDQWCRSIKEAGMKTVILTAKHHDGYVLWQSRYTTHGVMGSPWLDGKGDVMASLAASARKHGLKVGVYLSPADLYQMETPGGLYGNGSSPTLRTIPAPVEGRPFSDKRTFQFCLDDYNAYYLNQLFELLTEYGPIDEVWLDGAHPRRKGGQKYDYTAWRQMIRTLAPQAVIFGREDLRWCGNEQGETRSDEWNTIPYDADPQTMTIFPDLTQTDLGSREAITAHAKPCWLHYQPAEYDLSIRDGWFWRNDNEQAVRTPERLFDIYERTVGGNAIMLLNIPPDTTGRFAPRDLDALQQLGHMIDTTYGNNLLTDSLPGNTFPIDLTRPITITLDAPALLDRVAIAEPVATHGERIESLTLEGLTPEGWQTLATTGSVGYRRYLRFNPVTLSALRITVKQSRDTPFLSKITAHLSPTEPPQQHLDMQHIIK